MGISQGSIAQAVGWTQQKISYIETGARRMDVLEFIALARALGLSPVAAFRRAESWAPAERESRPPKANRKRSA